MPRARVWHNRVIIRCPGCDDEHALDGRWEFNGDVDKPTLSPSLLLSYAHGAERKRYVCHSFVRDGQIQFLSDSTHALAGKTVDLPEVAPDAFG